jgi:hypothetical protein
MTLRLLLALAFALATVTAAAEPPDQPGLVCTVLSQQVANGMSLEIRFTNETESDLSLGPGPHLVWYLDAQAREPMDNTARAARVQNGPLVVPAKGARVALYAIAPKLTEQLGCNPARPAAAALYFYQFNPRPSSRCVLQGYDLEALGLKPGCAASSPFGQGAASK